MKPRIKRAFVKYWHAGKQLEGWRWVCEGWDGADPFSAWFCWWYDGGYNT
jgi:hypothetical protein